MSPATAASGAALFYRTLPLIKRTFLRMPAGRREKLPPHLFATLLCLHRHGRQKMSVISDRLGLSKPLVTQHVKRLVAEGYCVRSADPADRRIIYIEITPKGTAHARKVSAYFREKGVRVLSALAQDDLDRFCDSMQTILEVLTRIVTAPGGAARPVASRRKNV